MNNPVNSKWHDKRKRAERRFRAYGIAALSVAVFFLILLMGNIISRGLPGFIQAQVQLPIYFSPDILAIEKDQKLEEIPVSSFILLVQEALHKRFPGVEKGGPSRKLFALVSTGAALKLKKTLVANPQLLSTTQDIWIPTSSNVDLFFKDEILEKTHEEERKLNNQQIAWLKELKAEGKIKRAFNTRFFSHGDSRTPERAGFLGAMMGSALTLIVCLLAAFPIGVMTAVYLEEFARKGRLVDIIEVNINNLAAVPSIVFGLLGLAVYINVMGMPRSAALVGGLTLALMSLPVIIIATRASLKAIPDSIRDAARALGASPIQVVWHHTLPLAMPGIMTGTILAMARAIGETAPLIMIGMVAFVADLPNGFTSPATVMPVQIYLWASSPELGFTEKTAAGILVLLMLLVAMNALAIYLRKKFEVRW
jgi:phosphate transport system permease protein